MKPDFKVGQKIIVNIVDDELEAKKGAVGVISGLEYEEDMIYYVKAKAVEIKCWREDMLPYTFRTETSARLRKLQRHPLFELAEQNPVFVVNGIVYGCDGEANGNYFEQGEIRRGLTEIAPISSLDELAF